MQALAIRLFLVPGHLVNGGIGGLAQLINYYTGFPIGVMILIGNIPLLLLGWRHLGGRRFAIRTAYAVVVIAFFTDFLVLFLTCRRFIHRPGAQYPLRRGDQWYRLWSGLPRAWHQWWHRYPGAHYQQLAQHSPLPKLPDHRFLIMLLGGLTYSGANALYAIIMLFISGIAAEVTTEGPNVVRTAFIITAHPDLVSQSILTDLERGVTSMDATGVYTGTKRSMLYCVITRSEVSVLKSLVLEADPDAFIVIGQAHEVLGEGFRAA